jgi:hypothetical protein
MQDTSPAARQPREEPAENREATWFDACQEPPPDEPLIAEIPVPDLP